MRRVLMFVVRCLITTTLTGTAALADEPLAQRGSWSGSVGHYFTGTPLAADTDQDGNVDAVIDTAAMFVSSADVPAAATLEKAILYWGGSQVQSGDPCAGTVDTQVTLVVPLGDTLSVTADTSYCSDGGAASYDMWICKADITNRIAAGGASLAGTWRVSDYGGRISDNGTDNASTTLLLVFSDPSLPSRQIVLHDGNMAMQSDSTILNLTGLNVGDPAQGTVTCYTLEGDPGGSTNERITVTGWPGGLSAIMADSVNPLTNPMNATINVTEPPATNAIGMDLDRYDIGAALTAGDTGVDVVYSAGTDKWWLAVSVTAVGTDRGCLITTIPGDVDQGGAITASDLIYLVNYVFKGGADPEPCQANGDVDCNGTVTSSDIVYIVNHVFKSGPAPCDICTDSPIPCG